MLRTTVGQRAPHQGRLTAALAFVGRTACGTDASRLAVELGRGWFCLLVHELGQDGLVGSTALSWLRRGVNVAGVFDRRDSDRASWLDWDAELETIAAAGFSHVRLPVRWWGHAGQRYPYKIDEAFADDVDRVVAAAAASGLGVVLSMHHADGVMNGDAGAVERLCGLWDQLAGRYRWAGGDVAYDLLNEPRAAMTSSRWNALLPAVVETVRAVDPARIVIVGGAEMGTLTGLEALAVPADEHLVLTFHYYEPFQFTHQGAFWESGSATWVGTRWGAPHEHARVSTDLEWAASWAAKRGLALYMGEFGTIGTAEPASRAAWTEVVRVEAERCGIGWSWWDYRTDFAVRDPNARRWHTQLLIALTG